MMERGLPFITALPDGLRDAVLYEYVKRCNADVIKNDIANPQHYEKLAIKLCFDGLNGFLTSNEKDMFSKFN